MRNPRIEMLLIDERGVEKVRLCYDLDPLEIPISVPKPDEIMGSIDDLVHQFKGRDYRKYSFGDIGRRLGKLMSERLEDQEGWHGKERMEQTQ